MKLFDQIIGYEETKKELLQIADIVHHPEAYTGLGAKIPKGILLHGAPGLGKTMMAKALMEEMQRRAYILHRNSPDGDFVKEIKNTFDEAAAHAPSIILLDDMDHFPAEEKRSEEFTVVQACIDEIREKEVFVIATANELREIPESLQRAGRFDRIIGIKTPNDSTAIRIIEHYMSDKPFVADVHAQDIARLLVRKSCAELETILNEAAIYAGYERCASIKMEHIVRAYLRSEYKENMEDYDVSCNSDEMHKELMVVAYHEAGHIVVGENLSPGCMGFAYLKPGDKSFVQRCRNMNTREQALLVHLGGIAAEEVQFGCTTSGSHTDIEKAMRELRQIVVRDCLFGTSYVDSPYHPSDRLSDSQERIMHYELNRNMIRAKQIIAENRRLLVAIANELLERRMLMYSDIQRLCNENRSIQNRISGIDAR